MASAGPDMVSTVQKTQQAEKGWYSGADLANGFSVASIFVKGPLQFAFPWE